MHLPRGLSHTHTNRHMYVHIYTYIYKHTRAYIYTRTQVYLPTYTQRPLSRLPILPRPNNGALYPAGPKGHARRARGREPRGGVPGSPWEDGRDEVLPWGHNSPEPSQSRALSPNRAGSTATGTVRPPQRPGQRHFRSRREAPGSARSPLGDAPRGGGGGFAPRSRRIVVAPGPPPPVLPVPR